jgi:hypothetical protein
MVYLKTDTGEVWKLPVPSSYTVGRGNSSDIKPDSKSVSKKHGRLIVEKNAITGKPEAWVEDFNSTFGTYVGESPALLEKVTEKTRLFYGFYIRFGHAPQCFQYLEHFADGNTTAADTTNTATVDEGIPVSGVKASATESKHEQVPPTEPKLTSTNETKTAPPQPPKQQEETLQERRKRESRSSRPLSTKPLYLQTDEELALQLQFGTLSEEPLSSSRVRTQDLIQQFESKFRTGKSNNSSPPSSGKGKNNSRSSMDSDNFPEQYQQGAFGEMNASQRDMVPNSSFLLDKPSERMASTRLHQPAESFSDLLWEESQSVVPTPTICQPPSKSPRSFQDSEYGSFKYDMDEKLGAEEAVSVKSVKSFRTASSSTSSPRAQPSSASTASKPTYAAPPGAAAAASSLDNMQRDARAGSPHASAALHSQQLQELEDSTLAAMHQRSLNTIRARQVFREQKRGVLQETSVQFPTYKSVAKQWRKPVASVDSVAGGFCISVVLPYMDRVKIKPTGKEGNKVRIDARRWVDKTDTIATHEDSEYYTEFKLQGLHSAIQFEDISHDYCEVTGLLCVYVNRFKQQKLWLMKKKCLIPLLTSGAYVPARTGTITTTAAAAKKACKLSSMWSWWGRSKEKEEATHQRNAKIYKKVLSRKSSMLQEGAGASATQQVPPEPHAGGGWNAGLSRNQSRWESWSEATDSIVKQPSAPSAPSEEVIHI